MTASSDSQSSQSKDIQRELDTLRRFKELASLRNMSLKQLCDHILNSAIEITNSPFGFLGVLDDDEQRMVIHAWSGEALAECKMATKPMVFNIGESGIWAEAVRLRTPLLMNRFEDHHPAKKGLPTGHVKLKRLLSIPIIVNNEIEGVVAVANKATDYTPNDIESLESFAKLAWVLIENQNALIERKAALRASERKAREQAVMFNSARWVLESQNFTATARKIFDASRELTGAQSGYVALLTEEGAENEVLFLESGGLPCNVDESLPMPIRGLRAEAYKTHQALYNNDFMNSPWVKFMPAGHVHLRNVLFAPLNIQNTTVGIMGLANKNGDFTNEDLDVATMLGDLAAIALQNQRSQSSLRDSESYLSSIFQNMGTGLAVYDVIDDGADFQFSDMNKAGQSCSGVELEDVRNKRLSQVFPATAEMGLVDKLRACYQTGEPQYLPLTQYEDDRITLWLENRIFKLPTGQVVAMYEDRTRQRQLEERLKQSEKMESIGHLAGGIAHDFNNILAAIIGYSELGLDYADVGSRKENCFQQILHAADRAKDMVYGILSFSRQGAEEKSSQFIRPVVKEVVLLLQGSLPSTIKFDAILERDLAPVMINTTQIHEVVINLCTNAAYAMNDIGTIHLFFGDRMFNAPIDVVNGQLPPGQYATIRVSDTGDGISESMQSKIFDPFFTTKPQGEGTGMGLAMVFGIIEDHGGGISVESKPGEGTTFSIYLPYSEAPVAELDLELKDPPCGRESIMIIDDEEMLCEMMSDSLRSLGYQTFTFTDSLEALRKFGEDAPAYDLVITDQTMPGLSGAELVQEMLRIRPDVPIILCTGYSKKIDAALSEQLGVRRFFHKPVHLSDLATEIRKQLDQ